MARSEGVIARERREFTEDNRALYWLRCLREAWLRILALDRQGALRICQSVLEESKGFQPAQVQIVASVAAGYVDLDHGHYPQAIEHFGRVLHPEVPKKFFLHWMWRLTAQLETANAWPLSGELPNARKVADNLLKSALATADPHLQALAWELKTRVAMADNDFGSTRDYIGQALKIVDKSEILVAAWQVYATAWRLVKHCRNTNWRKAAANVQRLASSKSLIHSLRMNLFAQNS